MTTPDCEDRHPNFDCKNPYTRYTHTADGFKILCDYHASIRLSEDRKRDERSSSDVGSDSGSHHGGSDSIVLGKLVE